MGWLKWRETLKPGGRYNRRQFLFWFFIPIIFVVLIFTNTRLVVGQIGTFLSILLVVFLIYVITIAMIKRCHDLYRSGWWVLYMLVPIPGVLFFVYLLFWPGKVRPDEPGTKKWTRIILPSLAAIFGLFIVIIGLQLFSERPRPRPDDALEPNNDIGHATRLVADRAMTARVNQGNDDYFAIDAAAGRKLTFRLQSLGLEDRPSFSLFGPDKQLLYQEDASFSGTRQIKTQVEGVASVDIKDFGYELHVSTKSSGTYYLVVHERPQADNRWPFSWDYRLTATIEPVTEQGAIKSAGPAHVTAAPNASVVTAKVLDVIQQMSGVSWEMVVEIQAAEIAPGFRGGLSTVDIGKTFTMGTSENISELKKGEVITAYVTFVGDERGSGWSARDIQKRTE